MYSEQPALARHRDEGAEGGEGGDGGESDEGDEVFLKCELYLSRLFDVHQ